MKKYLAYIIILLSFLACSDGDLVQEEINFDDVSTQFCSDKDLIFKIKGQELLLLQGAKNLLKNETSVNNIPTTATIGSGLEVFYRFYDGALASENLCGIVPLAKPSVTEEWKAAAGGIIEITTTAVKTINAETKATQITGYSHAINFKNITFIKPGVEAVSENLSFGTYTTPLAVPLRIDYKNPLQRCPTTNQLYNFNTQSAIYFTIDPSLIPNEATQTGQTRIGYINSNNSLKFVTFSTAVTSDYFCTTPLPSTPAVLQTWTASASNTEQTTGIVEVTTTTTGPNSFKHTITLKKVTLTSANENFTLGDTFVLGSIETIK